ncbi:MAG TPA: hypothetical protein VFB84_00285 [Micromonosporaceae bacterium]|nr:hypothetical protein [Micromonosporaceae bacterium]
MTALTLAEINRLRATPGATVVLFLTDRCPVGCAHCSVSATATSPTIRDWPLFTEVVRGVCGLTAVQAVAVTGGEPFAARRGLCYAVDELRAAGKAIVVFTSGYWATGSVPEWTGRVLASTATVFLSTDSFHARALAARRPLSGAAPELPRHIRNAAAAITAAGCHLVVQVLNEPGLAEAVRTHLPDAEVSVVGALATGRGADAFAPGPRRPAAQLGRCTLLNSPTIRYDGTVTACCNESVITGSGPAALRRRVTRADEVAGALASLRAEPVAAVMARFGPPALPTLAVGSYHSICEACWQGHADAAADKRVHAYATVLGGLP